MRKYLSIGLLFFFLFSTVGVIAGSYCCGMNMELMGKKNCCTPASKDCCQKEVKLLKIDDDFLTSSHQHQLKTFLPVTSVIEEHHSSTLFSSIGDFVNPSVHAPPENSYELLPFIQSFLI